MQIHDRDAHAEVVATLRRVGAPERTVFHCFSGDAAIARICAENGWYLSFAGTVTFKNAGKLREALGELPREPHPGRDGCAVPHADAVPRAAELAVPDPAHAAQRRWPRSTSDTDVSMLAAQISSNTELRLRAVGQTSRVTRAAFNHDIRQSCHQGPE